MSLAPAISYLAAGQSIPVLRFGLDHDRHEAVILAAQFGALATVGFRLVNVEPRVAYKPENRVLLHSKRRHSPGVDHVVSCDQRIDLFAYWDHRWVVDLQQVVLAFRRPVLDLLERAPLVRDASPR